MLRLDGWTVQMTRGILRSKALQLRMEAFMECSMCREPFMRRSQPNVTPGSRVVTRWGDVHTRCLAYLVVSNGLEATFGPLTARQRDVALARLNLPSVAADRADGVTRYRKVHDAAEVAGSYAPEVTDTTAELFRNARDRAPASPEMNKELAVKIRQHLDQVASLLAQLT